MHVARIVGSQPLMQGVTIRIFQRRNGEMRALASGEPAGGPDGAEMRIEKKVFDKHKDSYYQECKMKW